MQDFNIKTEMSVTPSLRDMALQALSSRGGVTAPIVQYLRAFEEAYSDDFVYLLILRQELIVRMIQQISTNIQKQYMEAVESYALDQSDWLEDVNKNIRRQEHFFRSYFQRVRRVHRERLFERLVICGAWCALAFLLALSVFYMCRIFE